MKLLFPLLLIIFSLIGLADASYITYEEFAGIIPPCSQGFQCEKVLTSDFAHIGPIPISLLGIFYYLTVFTLSICLYLDLDFKSIAAFKNTFFRKSSPLDLLQLITIGGLAFTLYLLLLMGVILKAWCLYCLISATTSVVLFLITQIYTSVYATRSGYITKSIFHFIAKQGYALLLKPLFFLIDPETVHNNITAMGDFLGKIAVKRYFLSALFAYYHPNLERNIDGISFPNPVGLSAGFDYNGNLTGILPSVGFGWHTIGTVTLQPYAGNQKPRLGRFPKSQALLVNKGLKNIGAVEIIKKLKNVEFKIPTGISIASTNKHFKSTKLQIADIIECFKLFEKSKVKHLYYELNISCPNTFGGEPFNTTERLETLLRALDSLKIKRPVYVKMPIDQSEKETLQLLKVIDKHKIAGVIMGNLTKDKSNPAVDPQEAEQWQNKRGNLSGKPTFERSNALIALTKKHFKNRFTIIGTGGIFTPEDAEKKIELGADLLQLITGMIYQGPQLIGSINRELANK